MPDHDRSLTRRRVLGTLGLGAMGVGLVGPKAAFAEPWDAIVLGTGMKECLLSGLLSRGAGLHTPLGTCGLPGHAAILAIAHGLPSAAQRPLAQTLGNR